jgi:beta-phosphoglucomutase family hydrolase
VRGLSDTIRACLFDLDGVLTPTAVIHAAAWKELFDRFLAERDGPGFVPFDPIKDYERYVDGRPRADGTRTFLAARGIGLPEDDIARLGAGKDAIFLRLVERDGVRPYPGSVRFLEAARDAGLRRAVVSSSSHCAQIVRTAGLEHLLEARVDGVLARERRLRGKPDPDTFLAGAALLGVEPGSAAVFEDALAGVAAGRAGGFGRVVGVDRLGQAEALRTHGADVVVSDLAELLDPQ